MRLQALRRSLKLRHKTQLVVFLGTPHRGRHEAAWDATASNLARLVFQDSREGLIQNLDMNNEGLDTIQDEFLDIVRDSGIRIHSFQEARETSNAEGLSAKASFAFSSP